MSTSLAPCIYPLHSIERNIMYGQHITISGPFASAVDKVTAALKNEGFGILSDIDIQKAMKEKLGVEMPAYRILGDWSSDVCSSDLPVRR